MATLVFYPDSGWESEDALDDPLHGVLKLGPLLTVALRAAVLRLALLVGPKRKAI